MSDLVPRAARERRAMQLVTVGGIAAVVGVVGLILAIAGAMGAGIPIIALIVAAVCIAMFRGMTRPRS
jgi:amino acid transporter